MTATVDLSAGTHARTFPFSLAALLVAIPLAVPLAVDVVGTISFSVLHAVLLALLFGNFLRAVSGRDLLQGGRTQGLLLAAVLALGLLNLGYAMDLPRGVAHWMLSALLFSGFWVVRTRVDDPKAVLRVIDFFVASSLPILAYGIIQPSLPPSMLPRWAPISAVYLGSTPFLRAFSTFENVLYFALYANVVFSLGVARLVGARGPLARTAAAAAVLLAVAAMYRAASIGALVGMAAGGCIAVGLGRPSRLLVAPIAGAIAFLLMPEPFRFKVIGLAGGFTPSLSARLLLYESAIEIIRDHPILGVGLGSVQEAMHEGYRVAYTSIVASTSENFLLERGIESGLPGLFLYVAILGLGFRDSMSGWRHGTSDPDRREAARAVLAYLTAFSVQGLTIAVGSFAHMTLFGAFLGLASVVGAGASRPCADGTPPQTPETPGPVDR